MLTVLLLPLTCFYRGTPDSPIPDPNGMAVSLRMCLFLTRILLPHFHAALITLIELINWIEFGSESAM